MDHPPRALANASATRTRVHALAVGLSAFCLFAAQPIAAKFSLPRMGGTPAVWNAVSLFFQVGLLLAYVSAHAIARTLAPRVQTWAYALCMALACALVWSQAPAYALDSAENGDFTALLWSLGLYMGLPAFALGMSTPLWSHRHVMGGLGDPYWLYAASNLGSFFALLAYPFVLEPWLGLQGSFELWRGCLSALTSLAVVSALRPGELRDVAPASDAQQVRVSASQGFRWAALAGLVAAYSLALTVHLSTDLAPAPWLWSLPLAIYLATYVLAFSRFAPWLRAHLIPLTPLVAATNVVVIVLELSRPTPSIIAALLVGEFFVGLSLHLDLAHRRPAPEASTAFYGWIAFGGFAGALAVSVLAPLLSERAWDLPVVLALCLFALPKAADAAAARTSSGRMALVSALLVGLAMILLWQAKGPTRPHGTLSAFAFSLWLPLFWPAFRWPRAAARLAALLLLGSLLAFDSSSKVLALGRSQVGAYRVTEDPKTGVRALAHGRTIHGSQSSDPRFEGWALPYHHPRSPIAQRFAAMDARLAQREAGPRVAVVGLGVGNMASAATDRWEVTFFEIDPLVAKLARDHFDFLDGCAHCEVVIADGRLGLRDAKPSSRRFDMIVLDAFSSDAVPLHLLTREALQSYVARLSADGEIMVHITNRHVDLRVPLADLAAALDLQASTRGYLPAADPELPEAARTLVAPTLWLRLTPAGTRNGPAGWTPLPPGDATRAWSDDRASVLSALGEALPSAP